MESPLGRWSRPSWGWRGGEAAAAAAAASHLEQILHRLERTVAAASFASQEPAFGRLSSVLHPPATPDTIAETELRLGAALPEDYTHFLLRWDGASVSDTWDPSRRTLELLGTTNMIRCAEEAASVEHESCVPETLVFARVGSDGDLLAFETGRMNPWRGCAVLDGRQGYRTDQWWVISRDFTEWLDRVLSDPGPTGSFGRHRHPAVVQPTLPLTELLSSSTDLPDPDSHT